MQQSLDVAIPMSSHEHTKKEDKREKKASSPEGLVCVSLSISRDRGGTHRLEGNPVASSAIVSLTRIVFVEAQIVVGVGVVPQLHRFLYLAEATQRDPHHRNTKLV